MSTIIEELEEQVEYWRARAEAAEAALGMGDQWGRAIHPLSLQMTRIMRLLVTRPMTAGQIADQLQANDYPLTTERTIIVRICQIRRLLPGSIMPFSQGYSKGYRVADPAALAEFLATGVLPAQRRAA